MSIAYSKILSSYFLVFTIHHLLDFLIFTLQVSLVLSASLIVISSTVYSILKKKREEKQKGKKLNMTEYY